MGDCLFSTYACPARLDKAALPQASTRNLLAPKHVLYIKYKIHDYGMEMVSFSSRYRPLIPADMRNFAFPEESWLKRAIPLPLAFAQTREDPLLDEKVVARLGPKVRVAMISSGGCTVAHLASLPNIISLDLVDPNPAQLALTRLKLLLTQKTSPAERLSLLGHAPMPAKARGERLTAMMHSLDLPVEILGPLDLVAEIGPDQAGRYEAAFQELSRGLTDQKSDLESLLRLTDPSEQARQATPDTHLGQRLDEELDRVLALPNLVGLFGEGATHNPVEPFSRHFAGRIRYALATQPASTTPFLWQMLLNRYPENHPAIWQLSPEIYRLPAITWHQQFMADHLQSATPGSFDMVHLSNILDWLTPGEARITLDLAWRALRPGGLLFIRQLNSSLDIQAMGTAFAWLIPEAANLLALDRSFFYRALHLGKKP